MIVDGLYNPVYRFIASGGSVLGVIVFLVFVIWTLIIERYWYYAFQRRRLAAAVVARWSLRVDKASRASRMIRACWVSQFRLCLERRIDLIRALVSVSLLLGLFGTVTGMIRVFEAMAMFGAGGWGGIRAIADGITAAVMPAMAGLVAALSGIYFASRLRRQVGHGVRKLHASLPPE